jgi:hypothetical protein
MIVSAGEAPEFQGASPAFVFVMSRVEYCRVATAKLIDFVNSG